MEAYQHHHSLQGRRRGILCILPLVLLCCWLLIPWPPPSSTNSFARLPSSAHLPAQLRPIQRVDGRNLSYQEFIERFAQPGEPVIIENYPWATTMAEKWTPQRLRAKCGQGRVEFSQQYDTALQLLLEAGMGDALEEVIMRAHNLTVEGYREAMAEGMTFAEFQDYMDRWTAEHRDAPSLHSTIDYFGLPFSIHTMPWRTFCPAFLEDVMVPKFFNLDFLSTNQSLLAHIGSEMPEAFIAPKDAVAYPMHLHPLSTSVWLHLLEGRKEWWLLPYLSNGPEVLYPEEKGLTFAASAIEPNLRDHPGFANADGWTGVMEKGDLLWMPAGMVHQVRNQEASYMMAYQYADYNSIDILNRLPERYVDSKDVWSEHLYQTGLSCFKPGPKDVQALDNLGDIPLIQALLPSAHPLLPSLTQQDYCASLTSVEDFS